MLAHLSIDSPIRIAAQFEFAMIVGQRTRMLSRPMHALGVEASFIPLTRELARFARRPHRTGPVSPMLWPRVVEMGCESEDCLSSSKPSMNTGARIGGAVESFSDNMELR